jgi:uncharacterized membrane protein
MNVMKSITVARPRSEVYAFWRDFENLPRFMHHLESVEILGGGRSHWSVKSPIGKDVEWDAEVVEDRRNERISWRTIGADDDVRHAGSVSFRPLGDSQTEVQVDLTYDAPGGRMGAIVARLFGEVPGKQIEDDLERFKRILETGDVERPSVRVDSADLSARRQQPVEPIGRESRADRRT